MRNKKVILSSILSLVFCLSLIAGATFALFTSESKTNIAITSGKVEVVATIENFDVYSPTLIWEDGTVKDDTNAAAAGVFVNGGTATLEGAKLTLDKMTPGDKVTFQIKITNNSNVAVLYRSIIMTMEDNGLFDGLEVTIGEIFDGATKYSDWTPLSVDEKEIVLDCSVELPTTAGNAYQDKTCAIVFAVEAVQGNTATTNAVARIGDTEFTTLEGAISAVQEGQTIEITRPGTYAPFTIGVDNVTVKGIVGETKAESTVIKNTATDRIILGDSNEYAGTSGGQNVLGSVNGVTLENLWIDSTVQPNMSNWGMNYAIVTVPYYEMAASYAVNTTITGCYFEGNGEHGVLNHFGDGLTFSNNTVKNFSSINYAESNTITSHTITGNTIEGVESALSYVMTNGGQANITITNNTVVDSTMFTLWDYAQWQNRNSTEAVTSGFANVTISGNNGNINYHLTHFDYKTETHCTISVGEGNQAIRYFSGIASDIPAADKDNYSIVAAYEESAFEYQANWHSMTTTIGGNAAIYTLATGEYYLVDKATGSEVAYFTVTDPVVGKQQSVELPNVQVTVGTVDELKAAIEAASAQATGDVTINLTQDFDLTGWTAITPSGYGTNNVIFNGNGHTLYNLTDTLFVGSFGGSGSITINDLTIANANIVRDAGDNGLGAGAFVNYCDASGTVILNNCTLKNSTVTCTNGYAGGLLGYTSAATTTITNCSVIGCTISGQKSAGAIVGHGQTVTVKGCTVTGNTITETLDGRTDPGAAAIVGRINGGHTLTLEGTITITGNTINQGDAVTSEATSIYCANANAVTTDATIVTE